MLNGLIEESKRNKTKIKKNEKDTLIVLGWNYLYWAAFSNANHRYNAQYMSKENTVDYLNQPIKLAKATEYFFLYRFIFSIMTESLRPSVFITIRICSISCVKIVAKEGLHSIFFFLL